jgi:hypothetical protein
VVARAAVKTNALRYRRAICIGVSSKPQFLPRSTNCGILSGYFVGRELEGHKATEFEILGLVNDTHPATAEFLDDAVV